MRQQQESLVPTIPLNMVGTPLSASQGKNAFKHHGESPGKETQKPKNSTTDEEFDKDATLADYSPLPINEPVSATLSSARNL